MSERNPVKGGQKTETESLAAGIRAGNPEAFERFYRQTVRLIYFHARALSESDGAAWNLVQDTYRTAWNSIDQLREDGKAVSWLTEIALQLGHKQAAERREAFWDGEEEAFLETLPEEESRLSETPADRKETILLIREEIQKLPSLQQAAVIAYYVDQMTVGQIARAAGCSEGMIRSRLNSAGRSVQAGLLKKERETGEALFSLTAPLLVKALHEAFTEVRVTPAQTALIWNGVAAETGIAAGECGASAAGVGRAAKGSVSAGRAEVSDKTAGKPAGPSFSRVAAILAVVAVLGGAAAVGIHMAGNAGKKEASREAVQTAQGGTEAGLVGETKAAGSGQPGPENAGSEQPAGSGNRTEGAAEGLPAGSESLPAGAPGASSAGSESLPAGAPGAPSAGSESLPAGTPGTQPAGTESLPAGTPGTQPAGAEHLAAETSEEPSAASGVSREQEDGETLLQRKNREAHRAYGAHLQSHAAYMSFYLFDLNQDGIDELFVMDSSIRSECVFAYVDGSVKEICRAVHELPLLYNEREQLLYSGGYVGSQSESYDAFVLSFDGTEGTILDEWHHGADSGESDAANVWYSGDLMYPEPLAASYEDYKARVEAYLSGLIASGVGSSFVEEYRENSLSEADYEEYRLAWEELRRYDETYSLSDSKLWEEPGVYISNSEENVRPLLQE